MATLTPEDRSRTAMYAAERGRKAQLSAAGSLAEWLEALDVSVTVEPLSDANLDRAAQLFNKTNQMNLTTRRLSNSELAQWARAGSRELLTFRVADRFGDSGLTGIVGLEYNGAQAQLVDFILSCRVLGRQVEETLLHVAVDRAREHGALELIADGQPTPRNAPCLAFFRRSGFRAVADYRFVWTVADPYRTAARGDVARPGGCRCRQSLADGRQHRPMRSGGYRRSGPIHRGTVEAGHILVTERRLLDWQYRDPDGSGYSFVLARRRQDSAVLGILGYISACRFDPALARDNVIWLTTWKVRDDASVAGLGFQLLRYLTGAEPHVAVGAVGLTPTTLPIYSALGYMVGELQHYVHTNAAIDTFKLASFGSRSGNDGTPRRAARDSTLDARRRLQRNRVGSA